MRSILLAAVALLAVPVAARADDGALDAAFPPVTQGLHRNLGEPAAAGFEKLTLQPDGKLVAVGFARFGADTRIVAARYAASGTPDTSFGGGLVTTDVPGFTTDAMHDAMVLPDGRIQLAGTVANASGSDVALVRYNANGSLDRTLNGAGYRLDPIYEGFPGQLAHGNGAAFQGFGDRIAVAGGASPTSQLLLATFDLAGNSLSNQVFQAGRSSEGDDVIADPDGRFAVGGYVNRSDGRDAFAADRFDAAGALDATFAHSEAAFPGAAGARATAIARTADGKYVLAGFATVGANERVALARFNAGGGLDTSFGSGGMVTTRIGNAFAYDVLVQPDGKIVIAGEADLGAGPEVLLARYRADGALDHTFGGDGIVLTTLPGSRSDAALGLTRLPDGRLLVAGTDVSSDGEQRFLVLRYGSAPACGAVLGCTTVRPAGAAAALVSADLTKAIGVGIAVSRVANGHTTPVGSVSFGTRRAGAKPIRWNLKVAGRRLAAGRYSIRVRALRHGKVVAVSRPAILKIP